MSLRPYRDINKKKTKEIKVGTVKIGGNNPISVQSMTNTLTTDVKATIKQIESLTNEGADLVRVSCPDEQSTKALKEICKHSKVPIILFDPWIRYQHCLAESDVTKLNKAIYYVNCLKDLLTAIESVKDSNPPDFTEYVYPGNCMTNFKNLIQTLI